jgi:hypothetical protein
MSNSLGLGALKVTGLQAGAGHRTFAINQRQLRIEPQQQRRRLTSYIERLCWRSLHPTVV